MEFRALVLMNIKTYATCFHDQFGNLALHFVWALHLI